MWIVCVALVFGVAAATDNNIPNVSPSRNDANDQCSYTLSVPTDKCQNGSDKKLSSKIATLEALNQQQQHQLSQQSLAILELNNKLQNYIVEQNNVQNYIDEQNIRIRQVEDTLKEHGLEYKKYLDCTEYRLAGQTKSGVYNITLEHALSPLSVWCDMDTEKGGWTVIQRRQDGSVYFFNDWATYKKGFGNINGEYWLGNDNIYHLTNQKKYTLRVDMQDFNGKHYWAEYENFFIENEAHKYTLHIGSYKGTAGDSNGLTYSNGMPFSTRDQDNDPATRHCALQYKGAFWYKDCHHVNANAIYHPAKFTGYDCIFWYDITDSPTALKTFEMKVRPMTFHRK